jgi:hypothetical protein
MHQAAPVRPSSHHNPPSNLKAYLREPNDRSGQLPALSPPSASPSRYPHGPSSNATQDVYAFGVLLNELLGRQQPWAHLDVPAVEVAREVLAGRRPDTPLSCPRALQVQWVTVRWCGGPGHGGGGSGLQGEQRTCLGAALKSELWGAGQRAARDPDRSLVCACVCCG